MQILKPPAGGRSEPYGAHKHIGPRTTGTRRLMILTAGHLTAYQSKECSWTDHTLLLQHYKTPHYSLQDGIHSFDSIAHCGPLCMANKTIVFYFSQNSVFRLLFSTGEQRLDFSYKRRLFPCFPTTSGHLLGLSSWLSGKEYSCQCRRWSFNPWWGRSSGERKGNPF